MDRREARVGVGFWLAAGLILTTVLWWALAFVRLPDADPEWLARTRAVCFGTLENGLPEPWGWLTLIGSPLGMLVALLAIWGQEVRRDFRAIWGRPFGRMAVVLLVGLPLCGATWVGQRVVSGLSVSAAAASEPALPPMSPDYPRTEALSLPDFRLVDQHGKKVTPGDLAGTEAVLTLAFAHCRTVCPGLVSSVSRAAADLDAPVLIITLDPWRDTPGSLPSLAERWGLPEGVRLLSGEVGEVQALVTALDYASERDESTGEVAHAPLVYVVDRDGRVAYTMSSPPPDWIVEAVRRTRAES